MAEPRVRTPHLLLVEPDSSINTRLQQACATPVRVTPCADFRTARARLVDDPPDFLVTNLRLEEYNGLHLVLLCGESDTDKRVRCVLHTDRPDYVLIAEAQSLGALFERTERLAFALPSYLRCEWPPADRRDPRRIDRRVVFRGGRRASDLAQLAVGVW